MTALAVMAPVARAGRLTQLGAEIDDSLDPEGVYDIELPAEVLAAVKVDLVPLRVEHDPETLIGACGPFFFRDGMLFAKVRIWCPKFIAATKAGTAPRLLSVGYWASYSREGDVHVVTSAQLLEVSVCESGEAGEQCALPRWKPAAEPGAAE